LVYFVLTSVEGETKRKVEDCSVSLDRLVRSGGPANFGHPGVLQGLAHSIFLYTLNQLFEAVMAVKHRSPPSRIALLRRTLNNCSATIIAANRRGHISSRWYEEQVVRTTFAPHPVIPAPLAALYLRCSR